MIDHDMMMVVTGNALLCRAAVWVMLYTKVSRALLKIEEAKIWLPRGGIREEPYIVSSRAIAVENNNWILLWLTEDQYFR